MSDQPVSNSDRNSKIGKQTPTQAVADDSNAPTLKPQSREPQNPETIKSSSGTSVTGTSPTDGGQHVDVGTELGYYRLLKKLGEGGMGSVWQAVHTKLDKHVAVKVLPATWSRDPALLTRFEREMKAVGKLEHPHIVRAMDAGEFQGTHYLVMEFNEGQDLSLWVKSRGPQSVSNVCEMVRQAALGLAHAHDAGLIHRDIKPSNLFLTKSGKVKILDLGLARVQGDTSGGGQTLTGFGQVLGTPDYMAPEQWENTHTADGRSDLYALGCTLFYLLTGRAPFSDERHSSLVGKMKGHTLDPIPDLKSARRAAVADRPKLANDLVSDELDTLYRKLMSKRPEERFASASELVQALSAFGKSKAGASGVLVQGSPSTTLAPSIATAPPQPSPPTVPATITAPLIMTEFEQDTSATSPNVGDAPTFLAMLAEASSSATQHDAPASGRITHDSSASRRASEKSDHSLARRAKPSGLKFGLIFGGLAALILFGVILFKITKKDGTKLEVADSDDTVTVEITESSSNRKASRKASASGRSKKNEQDRGLTPSGSPENGTEPKSPISSAIDLAAELKPAESPAKPGDLPQPKPDPAEPSTTSNNPSVPDSTNNTDTKKPAPDSVISLTPSKTAPIKRSAFSVVPKVSLAKETFKPKPGTPISPRAMVWSPAPIKDLASWSIELVGHYSHVPSMSVSPDGLFVATTSSGDDSIHIWRFNEEATPPSVTLDRVLLGESGGVFDVAWSPDGQAIAVTSHHGHNVTVYDAVNGRKLNSYSLEGGGGRSVQWSPDSRWISAPHSGSLVVIDAVSGKSARSKTALGGTDGSWAPDGRLLATIDEERKLKIWNPIKLEPIREVIAFTQQLNCVAWSPDGRWIVTGGVGAHLKIWDASSLRVIHDLTGEHQEVASVAWEPKPPEGVEKPPNWPRLLSVGGRAAIWDAVQGKKLLNFEHGGHQCAWSSDGRRIISLPNSRVFVSDAESGRLLAGQSLLGIANIQGWSSHATADGKIVRVLNGQELLIFDGERGEYVKRIGNMPLSTISYSPKDDWLAIYDPNKDQDQIVLVDTATYEQRRPLNGHIGKVSGVNWSPDGKQLASSGYDAVVRIWKVSSGETTRQIKHDRPVRSVVWSPDGKSVATCAEDDIIRLFNADTGKELRKFDPLPSPPAWGPTGIAWAPLGDLIAIAPADAQARVLDVKSGKLSEPFVSFLGGMQSVAWSTDGKQLLVSNGNEIGYRAVSAKNSQLVYGHGLPMQWLTDKRRVLTGQGGAHPLQAVDTRRGSRLGVLFPSLVGGGWLCIGPDGHYRGSEEIEQHIVYVALHKDGSQLTYSPTEFREKFGWKNDPAKARLLKLEDVVTK